MRSPVDRWKAALSRRRVAASIRELRPGLPAAVGDQDFLVLSVVRNAELLIGQFVEYYLERAASRIVILPR